MINDSTIYPTEVDTFDSIICPPEVDTFLATSDVLPMSNGPVRMTVEERDKMAEKLESILLSDEICPQEFWGEEEESEEAKKLLRDSSC